MKHRFAILFFTFVTTSQGLATAMFGLQGSVTKIEDGRAIISTKTGVKKILLKNLSAEDRRRVTAAVGKKKAISLKILPEFVNE